MISLEVAVVVIFLVDFAGRPKFGEIAQVRGLPCPKSKASGADMVQASAKVT